jgi:uncharacterized protein (TIGR03435 family)
MLVDRFDLKLHTAQKEVPMYALVASKSGFKLKEVENTDGARCRAGRGSYLCERAPITQLAFVLAQPAGRPVVDMTGLTGVYNFDLRWTPDAVEQGTRDPGILAALEQVGLVLEPKKMPVQIIVIDHANRTPTLN